jgi:hypothetical protein
MERVTKINMIFYSSRGCESGGPERIAYGTNTDSILQFQLEMRDDVTKHYRKMKWSQLVHLKKG